MVVSTIKLPTLFCKGFALLTFIGLLSSSCLAQKPSTNSNTDIKSVVDSTAAGDLILTQYVTVHAPIEAVWDAYTTEAGWAKWSTPLVSIDLKVGGTIRTNYNPEGTLDDETANTLFIRNYVPHKLLTLQADIAPNWPEFMKEEAENLFNVILFESLSDKKTQITSYGMGYKNDERYLGLMEFFIKGNEMLYEQLKASLEESE